MFWNLREPDEKSGRYTIDWDKTVDLEQIECPANPNHRRGGKRTTELQVVLKKRRTFSVMWTWGNECLIQQHILDVFHQQGFTGFQAKPVHARFNRPGATGTPQFWELIVTGWAGLASSESGIRLNQEKSCPVCGSLKYSGATNFSRLIDEKNWDGSDFFMVWPLPKFMFVSDRVREFIQRNDIQLTQFVSPEDLRPKTELDRQMLNMGFSPGRLSNWRPEERAHQLGDPLGIF